MESDGEDLDNSNNNTNNNNNNAAIQQEDNMEVEESNVNLCQICCANSFTHAMNPCDHQYCDGCTERLVQKKNNEPDICPFCR